MGQYVGRSREQHAVLHCDRKSCSGAHISLTSDRDTLPTDEELRLYESTTYSQSEIVDPGYSAYGVFCIPAIAISSAYSIQAP